MRQELKADIENTKRDNEIDIMKGILMSLVVIGHAQIPIHKWIYLFHMPVFIMITGYLWNDSHIKKSFCTFFVRKIKGLWLPYIICNIFFIMIGLVNPKFIDSTTHLSFNEIIMKVFKILLFRGRCSLSNTSWYLQVLFFTTLLYFLVWKFMIKICNNTSKQIFFITVLSFLFLFVGQFCFYHNIIFYQCGTICTAFFTLNLGYIVRKFKNKMQLLTTSKALAFGLIMSITILVFLNYISVEEIRLIDNQIVNWLFYILCSLAGWVFVSSWAKVILKLKISKLFYLICKQSLYILSLHFLAFKIVAYLECIILKIPLDKIYDYPIVKGIDGYWWILYSIIGIAVPLCCGYVVNRIGDVIYGRK